MNEPTSADELLPASEATPAEAETQFAEDQTLTPAFVNSVDTTIEADDADATARLCEDLHPADLADDGDSRLSDCADDIHARRLPACSGARHRAGACLHR